ncbi:MAG: hypothetical protein AW12_03098 [Candidatus Accumulibacter sp. BA-94]|nr:MAG: hypothetical protein AW12_03098 [Candidatus Accumulibacter sp. BA-94]
MVHRDRLHRLAVDLQRARAGPAEAAHVVEGERADAQAVVLEVELKRVLAGSESLGTLPLDPLQVDQVPQEHRLALEQIEAVTRKASARGQDHPFGATLRHVDVGGDGVGRVEQERRIALRQAHHRPGVDELGAPGGDVRTRRDDARGDRRIQRQDLVLLGFGKELRAHFLHFLRVFRGDVVGLAEVPGEVIKLEDLIVQRIRVGHSEGLPGRTVDLGAEQPAVVVQRPLAHHLEVLRLVV